jgi:cellulose synthase/poly-beta-1,6-N-acetylglucosamine synthase-like glycosyltransferase
MHAVSEFAFWLSLAALLYAYAGFPLLVAAVGALRGREVRKGTATPRMTMIIAAYNEEDAIAERLDNALASDYPAYALEIIVASDGSTDATNEIVAGYASRGVRLLRLPRRGKIAALEQAVGQATGEILIFSDANTVMHPAAVRALASNFADPEVGGVAGHTTYRLKEGSESSSRGESLYWRYDTWLKAMESRTGSVVSAHGGLYALRRNLYHVPPDRAVTDDFIISTAVVEQGRRLVFEKDALAYEIAVPTAKPEFRRRVRLMTRGLRAVALRRRLMNPSRYGFYAVVLFSHKVLRRLVPVCLVVLFSASLYLASTSSFFLVAAVAQTLFYSLAVAGGLARQHRVGQLKLFYVPFFYGMANTAALFALVRFVRGDRIELWQPQRHAPQPS